MTHQILRILMLFLVLPVLAGAAAADTVPAEPDNAGARPIAASKQDLIRAAEKILTIQGFEIQRRDAASGILSTASGPMRLNLSGCECGLTMGPVEDERPIITVSIDVAAEDNRIRIRAHIMGDFPSELISEKTIEDDLFDQISRYLE